MTGELAQLIAIVSHGNMYMQRGEIQADFFPANSVFQFCNTITFYRHEKSNAGQPAVIKVADDPVQWMELQKQSGCNHFKLTYFDEPTNPLTPNYTLAGFVGGGGTWLIESVHSKHSRFTAKSWEVTDQHHPDRKIWSVRYDEHAEELESTNSSNDIPTLKLQLDGTLTDIAAFARTENLDYWADKFDKARSILHQLEPEKDYYHHDLIPLHAYSLEARQLLFGAAESWVFGGMGWWNDNQFKDQETYTLLTGSLYGLFTECISAAVNSPMYTL